MSWPARVLKFMQGSPVSLSAKILRDQYLVSNPSPVIKKLQEAGCIVEDYRHGNEVFWAPVPGAVAPADARPARMRAMQPMAVRARAMRRLATMAADGTLGTASHPTAAPGVRRSKRKARRIRA